MLFWVESGTAPDNVVMAEMPRYSDTSNVQAQYARRMVQKEQMHTNATHLDALKDMVEGAVKCKYGFPFKVPQFIEELDDEGIRFIYKCRCKEDSLVVP